MESALTTKGQATIPKAIRDHLHLGPGDKVKFFIHPDGTVVILPKLPATALKGMFRSRTGPVSIEQMDAGIAKAITSRFKRSNRK